MDRGYGDKMNRPATCANEAEGIVREIRGTKALVITDRKSMCGQCAAHDFCELIGGGKEMLSEALNPIGAREGDTVRIGLPSGTVTKASSIVYLVPTAGFIAGAGIGYYIGKLYSLDFNISTFIGCLAGLGLSLVAVRRLSNFLSKRPSYQPEIIKIIDPGAREV